MQRIALTSVVLATVTAAPLAAENRIDGQVEDAPALSAYGDYTVGVRQIELLNEDQIDILSVGPGEKPEDFERYDRPLTVEMWYPAMEGSTGDTTLKAYLRDGVTEVSLEGQAVRDAAPVETDNPFPLVMLSHGYPGNRFLMSHLAENLASKGYVVASIDHTDSTYRTQAAFGSTLVNRSLDQVFVLEEMAKLNADASSDFAGTIDADNTGLIGYSMGGYGAVITAGGGVTETSVGYPWGGPSGTLGIHQAGSETHEALQDDRIKTAIAIGPWGMNTGFWDAEGLAGIDIPMLFMAGSADNVSLYEGGVRDIWEGAINVDRALLTFEGAGHNAAAPIPAPEESFYFNDTLGFNVSEHYTDPVWDTVCMNNVAQHYSTAWFDHYLKGDASAQGQLDIASQNRGCWAGVGGADGSALRYEALSAAPVPLPASVWMLGFALGGLGLMRRKSKRAA